MRLTRLVQSVNRARHWVAPGILLAAFVVTQVLLRLPARGLTLARWLLTPHVLLAAVALWPLWLARRPPTPGRTGGAVLLSALTSAFSLLAIPLWAEHGCWAPDLYSFILMQGAGLTLALTLAPLAMHRLGRLTARQIGTIALVFVVTFCLSATISIGAAASAGTARGAVTPISTPQPKPVWSRTPWPAVWAAVAPRPFVDAAFSPTAPVVERGTVVFVGIPGKANILDARSGRTLWTATITLPGQRGHVDTARNQWHRPVASSGHVFLWPRGGNSGRILDLDTRTVHSVDLEGLGQVVPCPDGGFLVLAGEGLVRLHPHGQKMWSSRPQPSGPSGDFLDFRVNEFAPPDLSPWLVPTPQGIVVLQSNVLYVSDAINGAIEWQNSSPGRLAGMQVSPDLDIIYVAEVKGGDRQLKAYRLDGNLIWSQPLPNGCFGVNWVATPHGLVVAARTPEGDRTTCIGPDGKTRYSLPVSTEEPHCFRSYREVLLVASSRRLAAYRTEDGRLLWNLSPAPDSPAPGRFAYYQEWPTAGDTVFVPYGSGIRAYDLYTGEERWQYVPPGWFGDMAVDRDMVYITSSRGIFAVPGPH